MELESMTKLYIGLKLACVIAGLVVLSGIILFFVLAWVRSIYDNWKWRRVLKSIEKGRGVERLIPFALEIIEQLSLVESLTVRIKCS